MKLNIGCGYNHLPGHVNVDCFAECNPDVVCNLEKEAWPWEDSSIESVVANHSLEHMGETTDSFFHIMKELYRVCRADTLIHIRVPHPRHDSFVSDPTHVRPITPFVFSLFSKRNNQHWKDEGAANTPLGFYLNVDFELERAIQILDPVYGALFDAGKITQAEVDLAAREKNNVLMEYDIHLRVVK